MDPHQENLSIIRKHLESKHKYKPEYIDRVIGYLTKNPDLTNEFVRQLPKNVLLDNYIEVQGYSIRYLGARTSLSRSAIYVVLSRLREETNPAEVLADEAKRFENAFL